MADIQVHSAHRCADQRGRGGMTVVQNFYAPLGATSAEMQRIVRDALTQLDLRYGT